MKIVLANLPWRSFGKTGVRAGSRWPHLKGPAEKDYLSFPFFLAYAASLLKKNNFDAKLIDAIAEEMSYSRFLKIVRKIKPGLLVCETSTVTLNHDLRLLSKIKNDIPIAICGPDVNIRQPAFLKNHRFIDYVFVGEYELTLLDLAGHLEKVERLDSISGLIHRSSGNVTVNSPRPLARLDDLPWPLREELPMECYNDSPGDLPLPSVQVLASRGCPYNCKFCLWPQAMYQSNQYRVRNVIDVVDEMEYLVKKMNFKSVYFDDDTFNIGKERMLRLCDEIKKRALNTPWAIMARADLMDEEILINMKEAGLYAVKYGVESTSQSLLDSIDKNMSFQKTKDIIKFTKMLDIKTHLTFMFGLPGETRETIRNTIDFAVNADPTTVQFSIATPFPGTIFHKEMQKKGYILSKNWSEFDGNHRSVIFLEGLSRKDLEHAVKSAYRRWAAHCSQMRHTARTGLDSYYYQKFAAYIKNYGLAVTLFKAYRFVFHRMLVSLKGNTLCNRIKSGSSTADRVFKAGRLSLFCDGNGISMYWNGMQLTRGAGFATSVNLKNGRSHKSSLGCWDFEKINNAKFLMKTKYGILPAEETWEVIIIDEKQVDWNVQIEAREDIDILERKVTLILSEKYRKWIDDWGEGCFPPVYDSREMKTKNPHSFIIGLRGRKKLRGQLPTFLLDLSEAGNGIFSHFIKNTDSPFGARAIEIKMKNQNGSGKYLPGKYPFFSGRIKIVEEDFRKRGLKARYDKKRYFGFV